MTQGFKAEIFIEIAPSALLPRNDGILDGILEFFVMRSQVGGLHKAGLDDTALGILEFLGNFAQEF